MTLTIELPRELEKSLRTDADVERRSVEEVATRRLQEAELLRRIFSYFPPKETAELRSLSRRSKARGLRDEEQRRLVELAHQREIRNAERLADIFALSQLRGESVRTVMDQFGIRPFRIP